MSNPDLTAAARRVVDAWCDNSPESVKEFRNAMMNMERILDEVEVPEVEVTESALRNAYEDAGVTSAAIPLVVRRSGAKNVSAPEYQTAFISEARHVMGQPSEQEAEALVGKLVTLIFNVDKAPVQGKLTAVTTHPAGAPSYLVLNDDHNLLYPLNSVQEIQVAR
jgi:hypothetical protein